MGLGIREPVTESLIQRGDRSAVYGSVGVPAQPVNTTMIELASIVPLILFIARHSDRKRERPSLFDGRFTEDCPNIPLSTRENYEGFSETQSVHPIRRTYGRICCGACARIAKSRWK
jgi:hypothetical protein